MFNIHETIWAVINFIVFFVALRFVFYKPILKLLDKRQKEVADNLQQAEDARARAEEARAAYEERMKKAGDEAAAVVARAVRDAEEARAQLVARSEAEAARELEGARETIRRERDQALASLRREVASLAVAAAGRVLKKTLTPADQERLVKEFVDEVEQ